MLYQQLALTRHVLERAKEGKPLEITNEEKVDLDYLANHYDNVITEIEKDMKKNPRQIDFIFQMRVSKKQKGEI